MQQYINQIKTLVSCPPKIYSQLYLSTLSNFIIWCPVELIRARLKLTIAALKIRRGILLPKNAGAETIAAEEPQWTFAIFSSCLLKGLEDNVVNKILPEIVNTWFHRELFFQWRASLFESINKENIFDEIIQRAEFKLKNQCTT